MRTDKHKFRRRGGATVPVADVAATATRTAASETLAPPKKRTAIRWVAAPQSSLPGAPAVQGVMLTPNEDVQWSWTHTTNGSYVSGYNIVRSLPRKRQRPFAALRVTTVGGASN